MVLTHPFMMSSMPSMATAFGPSPKSSLAETRRTPIFSSWRPTMAASKWLRKARDRMYTTT